MNNNIITYEIMDTKFELNISDIQFAKKICKNIISIAGKYDNTYPNESFYFTYLVIMNLTAQELLKLLDPDKYKKIIQIMNSLTIQKKEEL